jgi:hypothetical protein
MARKPRVEHPGAIYHGLDRGDRREEILKSDVGRLRFLETPRKAGVKTGWFKNTLESCPGNVVRWALKNETPCAKNEQYSFRHPQPFG